MNRTILPFSVLLAVFATATIADVPAAPAARTVPLRTESFYDTWLKDRLSIGLGFSYATLTDSERPKDAQNNRTFIGFVWKLEDTDQIGVLPELRYWAADHLRLVLALDRVSARTRNYNAEKHSDGVADLWGPQLLVEGVYPLCDETVFLHAGVGVVYDFADFNEVNWWKLGYSSKADWEYLGRPSKSRQDYHREIRVDDDFGWTIAAGVSWRPAPRFELDVSLRHTWINPDCQFGFFHGGSYGFENQLDGDFDFDHLTIALTGSYVF